jgi:hypothetical protein
MLVLLLVLVASCIYIVLKLPEVKESNRELEKAEEERIRAKIRAENLKRKIRKIKKDKE